MYPAILALAPGGLAGLDLLIALLADLPRSVAEMIAAVADAVDAVSGVHALNSRHRRAAGIEGGSGIERHWPLSSRDFSLARGA